MLRQLPVSLRGMRVSLRLLTTTRRFLATSSGSSGNEGQKGGSSAKDKEGETVEGTHGIPWDCNKIDAEIEEAEKSGEKRLAEDQMELKQWKEEMFGPPRFKLYYDPLFAPARACYHLVKAQELPVLLQEIDVKSEQHKTPEMTKLNPFVQVPFLEDMEKKETITESTAILSHLCRKFYCRPRYPTSAWKRAKVDQYLLWHQSNIQSVFAPLLESKLDFDEEKVASGLAEAEAKIEFIEKHFLTRNGKPCKYLAETKRFSIADLALYHEASALERCDVLDRNKNLQFLDWLERMEEQTKPLMFEQDEDADGVWAPFESYCKRTIASKSDDRPDPDESALAD